MYTALSSDDLSQTVDYSKVYVDIRNVLELERYDLIETVAEKVAQRILSYSSVSAVLVRVKKPHVTVGGQVDYIGIEIVRTRPL